MVKVQRGWQDHSLEEVENLASKQAAPISIASATHSNRGVVDSSSSNVQSSIARGGALHSPERDTEISRLADHALNENLSAALDLPRNPYSSPPTKQTRGSSNVTPTYESFWRQHATKPTNGGGAQKRTHSKKPSLEPPVNILPRNPRRTSGQRAQPPSLYTKSVSNLSTSSEASSKSFVPATPSPQRRTATQRTPSQNAAMEKDAVETLLFMSSPINSGYLPRNGHLPGTPPVPSPSRNVAPKRVEFAGAASAGVESSDDELANLVSRQRASNPLRPPLDTEDRIDRMLDAVDSSSDEEM